MGRWPGLQATYLFRCKHLVTREIPRHIPERACDTLSGTEGKSAVDSTTIRFGVFELDVTRRQLCKNGIKIKLEQQPLEVLLMLLDRPGEVVARAEFKARLWPNGVHVDFDRSLNKAVLKLRETLGDIAESPRFIETRPRHGYRFIAPVERGGQVAETEVPPVSRRTRSLVWAACTAAAALAAAGLAWRVTTLRSGRPQVRSIAVLPLRNLSGDPDQENLASGMTEVLTTGLAQLGALDVIASSSTQRYKKMDKPPPQIARELNVDALVEGSVQRSGNRVLVTARLIDGTTSRQLWAKSYERDYRDALSLQAEIATVIAEEIGAKLTARTRRPSSANPEAQDAFLRGESLYGRSDFKRSFALYQQAIEKDPHFAAAYARLPFYYRLRDGSLPMEEGLAQWKAAVKRALELDPNLDEAHRAYGVLLGSEWNWKEEEREYKIALGLNPNLALAHQQYGSMLTFMGRAEEGIQELKRAQRLDPASGSIETMLAIAYWFARQPDELLKQAQRLEDQDPRWPPLFRGYAHELKGEFDQAVRDLLLMPKEDGAPIIERYIVERAHAYTALGKTREARGSLTELFQLSQKRKVEAWFFACLYAALGEKDRAFEWLDKAYLERLSEMVGFAASPDMDPLRSDPRYTAMLRRMRIPER